MKRKRLVEVKTITISPDSSGIAALALAKFDNFSKVAKLHSSSNENE